METSWKDRLLEFYEKNELKVDLGFFLGGFVFDIFTLTDIDDPLGILQQVLYLGLIGFVLAWDFLHGLGRATVPVRLQKVWEFRHPILHFFLGSLLSIYSLFFLKSASLFSSIIFVVFLLGVMVANELKFVQSKADLKIGLFVICLFSFFSMLFPVLLGFVGWLPFLLSVGLTGLSLWGIHQLLVKKVEDPRVLRRRFIAPGGIVLVLFVVFYLVGWIPPVPLSLQHLGIYHGVEKVQGDYLLSHENPWWKFWRTGDQDFKAAPGDRIHVFASVYSPARFDDSVVLHWSYKDPKRGWLSTDRVPMRVAGGRKAGYRGFAIKQNYSPGDWRVAVETTDGREIGRIYFHVEALAEIPENRQFEQKIL